MRTDGTTKVRKLRTEIVRSAAALAAPTVSLLGIAGMEASGKVKGSSGIAAAIVAIAATVGVVHGAINPAEGETRRDAAIKRGLGCGALLTAAVGILVGVEFGLNRS